MRSDERIPAPLDLIVMLFIILLRKEVISMVMHHTNGADASRPVVTSVGAGVKSDSSSSKSGSGKSDSSKSSTDKGSKK